MRHPAELERLAAEVAEDGDDDYLDAVIKETLRLRPVISIVLAHAEGADGDRRLRAPGRASRWRPCIYLVHRRPDVYPEPDRFRPERFLEQPAPAPTPGSRSAAACAAAWAARSRSSR